MRILLVEDDQDLQRVLKRALSDAGYVVDTANDGEEGHFLGDTEPYDVVILDLGLPKIDGLTVLGRWRRSRRKMPVLILTARDRWSEKVAGFDAGAGRVTVGGVPIKLTAQEFRLIDYLMHHKGKIVSRTELVEHIYDQDFDRESNTIEVFVGRLRKKLGANYITTVRGLGYRLAPPGDEA